MKIRVRVTPRSRKPEFSGPDEEQLYHAKVAAPPVDGKANDATRKMIAERFRVSTGSVRLINGEGSRLKTFELPEG